MRELGCVIMIEVVDVTCVNTEAEDVALKKELEESRIEIIRLNKVISDLQKSNKILADRVDELLVLQHQQEQQQKIEANRKDSIANLNDKIGVELRDKYKKGYSYKQLSSEYKIASDTIHKLLTMEEDTKELVQKKKSNKYNKGKRAEEQIVKAYTEERLTQSQIANKLDVSLSTVIRVLRNNNINYRNRDTYVRKEETEG